MKKRAQVTMFIIIGLVLVLSVMIYLGVQGKLAFFDPDAIISPDKTAVKQYVETCLNDISKEAVTLVSFQGGYAKIEEGPWKKSKGGEYQDFGFFKIPYWTNEGKLFMPTGQREAKELVEENIEMYIDSRIDVCLDNFTALRQFYEISEIGTPRSDVTLGTGRVTITLDYPLILKTVKKKGDTEINDYRSTVSSNLLEALELSIMIYNDELNNNRLWNQSMEVIAGSDLPYKGIEFECEDYEEDLNVLQSRFDSFISSNMNFLMYENTFEDNAAFLEEVPYPNYYRNRYTFDVGADSRHNKFSVLVNANPSTNFEIFPSKNGKVRSLDLQLPIVGDLIDPCMNLFNHFYTFDYPVKFSISDQEGMAFNFILPVNVLHNKPKVQPEQFSPYASNEVFLEGVSVDEFCKDGKYDISVYVEDSVRQWPNEGVPNATVYYDCVTFRCVLGTTDHPRGAGGEQTSTSTLVEASFPECYNGALVVESDNHMTSTTFVTPSEVEGSIKVFVKPIIELPLTLEIKRFGAGVQTELYDPRMSAVITVRNNDLDKAEFITYHPEEPKNLTIKLPFNGTEENNFTIDVKMMNLDKNLLVGGYTFEGELYGSDFADASRVVLPVLTTTPYPSDNESMLDMYENIIMGQSKNFDIKIE